MAVSVSATNNNPTHHISLTDSAGVTMGIKIAQMQAGGVRYDPSLARRSAVDRTAMKTSQGNTEYGDLEPPYYAVAQQDWTSGMFNEIFENSQGGYRDAFQMNTVNSGAMFPGAGIYTQAQINGYPYAVGGYPIGYTTQGADSRTPFVGFTPAVTTSYTRLYIRVRLRQNIVTPQAWSVEIRQSTTLLGTLSGYVAGEKDEIVDLLLTSSSAINLTAGTAYLLWLSVVDGSGFARVDYPIYENTAGNATAYVDYNNNALNAGFPNFVLAPQNVTAAKFFDYKGMPYVAQKIATGTWNVRRLGDRGAADSNAGQLTKLIDATKSWTTNLYINCIVMIVGGTGYNEPQRWRKITANDATSVTIDTPWTITHDTTTEYVIIGINLPITTASGIAGITDILVSSQGVIYLANGSNGYIQRMREYNNAGVWTVDAPTADGTNYADFLEEIGGTIWRATNTSTAASLTRSVSSGTAPAWGANITFGSAITVGLGGTSRITGTEVYYDDNKQDTLWVFLEDDLGFIKSSKYNSLQVREMSAARNEYNGLAHTVFNTYLYFGMMGRLERYYSPTLDDLGPNNLPVLRKGHISAMRASPGRLYVAMDATLAGNLYSSVYVFAGDSYHEIYRAPAGVAINDLFVLATPGTGPDILYVGMDGNVSIIWLPSNEVNPLNDMNYGAYSGYSSLIMSDITSGLKDVNKYTRIMKIAYRLALRFGGTLSGSYSRTCAIYADYWDSETESWINAGSVTNTATSNEAQSGDEQIATIALPNFGISAKRLKFRIRIHSDGGYLTPFSSGGWMSYFPIITAVVVETLARVENKFAYSIPFVFFDNDTDLQNQPDGYATSAAKMQQLDTWAGQGLLLMRSVDPLLDNKYVFLLPIAGSLVSFDQPNLERVYTGMLTLQDG